MAWGRVSVLGSSSMPALPPANDFTFPPSSSFSRQNCGFSQQRRDSLSSLNHDVNWRYSVKSVLTLSPSYGSVVEKQNLSPSPDPLSKNLHFNKMPRWFSYALWFEMRCCTTQILGVQINLKCMCINVIPYSGPLQRVRFTTCVPSFWSFSPPQFGSTLFSQHWTLFFSNSTSLKMRHWSCCPRHMLSHLWDFAHAVDLT